MLKPQFTVFFERPVEKVFQARWQIGIEPQRRRRCAFQDGVKDHAGRIAAKRQHARGHFVQHNAEREEVGARIQILAANLLWGHVGNGSNRCAGTGEVFRADARSGFDRRLVCSQRLPA